MSIPHPEFVNNIEMQSIQNTFNTLNAKSIKNFNIKDRSLYNDRPYSFLPVKDARYDNQGRFIIKIVFFCVITQEDKDTLVHKANPDESLIRIKYEDHLCNAPASVIETMVISFIVTPTICIKTWE